MSDLEHKKQLFHKYRLEIGEEELKKRLGLKDWEFDYITGRGEYRREWIEPKHT